MKIFLIMFLMHGSTVGNEHLVSTEFSSVYDCMKLANKIKNRDKANKYGDVFCYNEASSIEYKKVGRFKWDNNTENIDERIIKVVKRLDDNSLSVKEFATNQ